MSQKRAILSEFPSVMDIAVMLLLFFVAHLGAGALLSLCGVTVPEALPYESTDIETYMSVQVLRGERIAILYPLSMGLALLLVWCYVRLRGGRGLQVRHARSGWNPNLIFVGTLWVLAAQVVLEPLVALLPGQATSDVGRGFWPCVTALVMAPVLEELLCRGVVLESVRRRWGGMAAIFVSSLFFGLIHIEPSTALVAVVVGAIFGVLYLRASSLYVTIVVHSINNALSLALIYLGAENMTLYQLVGNREIYYIIYAVSLLIFVLLWVESWRMLVKRRRKAREAQPNNENQA